MFSVTEFYINEQVRVVNKNPKDKDGKSWAIVKGYCCLNKNDKMYELECKVASNYDSDFKSNCYMTLQEAFSLCIEFYGSQK